MRPLGLGLRKAEVDGLFVGRNLDPLDLFQFLDPALHLFGFGRLRAEAVDEGFQLLDLVLLIVVSRLQLRAALRLQARYLGSCRCKNGRACSRSRRFATPYVQKKAVVRNQDEGVRIVSQILLQPVARFQIQVIGGLVEQQQIGFFEQQFGQRDAHLPAAGKLFRAPLPVVAREAKPDEHRAHLRLDRIAVARARIRSRS